ncbi:MAG: bifunctional 3,4-dihydroxy-2-butanone-4-phosphate synthase/GTP cyclohydrolase II [Elusimicrobia bacterium]|jgi:3,4-dihydroxy 2-butanone 4-phosphate synthase/GTP cyclohydrolase II|nr:bifunctional 3,4-dihydroxy-2-butanone-4-phosphate synthase/GTP cyclohydrolase II [Elusimicrobiota bacterium]
MVTFQSVADALKDFKRGKPLIVVDDPGRENEGDVVIAAEKATPEAINFMAKEARGLICVPMLGDRLDRLNVLPMVERGEPREAAFTISVDAKKGVTTGISAHDRARTVRALVDPRTRPEDLRRPGHIFPLRYKEGGVLVRSGHTEAAVDLARLAGLAPAAVICEIMNDDGSMSRLPALGTFARRHGLKIVTIESLIAYRRRHERLVRRLVSANLPTRFGLFKIHLYEDVPTGEHHVALVRGEVAGSPNILVRVHSSCFTGDVLHSLRCDCGEQLEKAFEKINGAGKGVLLYMHQEGRGIGLMNKLHAYALQETGLDTVQANRKLGFKADLREYGIGAQILADLGLSSVRLLTNNPKKIVGIEGYGLRVTQRVSLEIPSNRHNRRYLATKRSKMGHQLEGL